MILKRGVLLCLVTAAAIGCSSALLQGVAHGLAASSPGSAGVKLMVFGGPGHKTYLGCLSCSSYSSESLFNSYGTYGSEYSGTSILNAYSEYGSLYGAYSACNPYASDPAVIVDGSGRYYGRLTVSSSRSDGPPPNCEAGLPLSANTSSRLPSLTTAGAHWRLSSLPLKRRSYPRVLSEQ